VAEPLKISGDVIKEQAEKTGEKIKAIKAIAIAALRDSPVEPRKWVQYMGRILDEAEEGDYANNEVKQIIYDSRRRNGKESE
jgi:hypothetical protein